SIYDAAVGRAQAETLAQATLEALSPDSPGVLAWDVAELAHTWFEWTEAWTALVRVSRETEGLEWVTLDRLAEREEQQVPSTGTAPVSGLRAISTWHPDVLSPWLAPANSWLLRHMHRLEQRLLNAVDGRHLNTQHELPPWQRRAIIVALRELLMLQSSDLAAAMVASSGVGHALERTQGHIKRAQRLLDMVERDAVDGRFIETLEQDTTLAALADPSHMLRG
ncbi:MAG: 1,4-alpha-glucan branching protein domain-containing protein, partial [Myxococcota bacterium]